jgi:biopolymer transport protein TolR
MRRFRRSEDSSLDNSELNLVPYLDIMVNLILFMLVTYQVTVGLHEVAIAVPAVGPGPAVGVPDPVLDVEVGRSAITVLSNDGTVGPLTIPRTDGNLDAAALNAALVAIADGGKPLPKLAVSAEADIPYDEIVAVLDAARTRPDGSALFTAIALGTLH